MPHVCASAAATENADLCRAGGRVRDHVQARQSSCLNNVTQRHIGVAKTTSSAWRRFRVVGRTAGPGTARLARGRTEEEGPRLRVGLVKTGRHPSPPAAPGPLPAHEAWSGRGWERTRQALQSQRLRRATRRKRRPLTHFAARSCPLPVNLEGHGARVGTGPQARGTRCRLLMGSIVARECLHPWMMPGRTLAPGAVRECKVAA